MCDLVMEGRIDNLPFYGRRQTSEQLSDLHIAKQLAWHIKSKRISVCPNKWSVQRQKSGLQDSYLDKQSARRQKYELQE